jgi:hypothetical protein
LSVKFGCELLEQSVIILLDLDLFNCICIVPVCHIYLYLMKPLYLL